MDWNVLFLDMKYSVTIAISQKVCQYLVLLVVEDCVSIKTLI